MKKEKQKGFSLMEMLIELTSKYGDMEKMEQINDEIAAITFKNNKTVKLFEQNGNYRLMHENSLTANQKKQELEKEFQANKKEERFVQLMKPYEEKIVGSYKKEPLDLLMKLLPFVHYNGNDEYDKDKILKINGKPATYSVISKEYDISLNTVKRYFKQYMKDGIMEPTKIKGTRGDVFKFKKDVILKGLKIEDHFSKKVNVEKLTLMINESEKIKQKLLTNPKTAEEKALASNLSNCYPMAMLAAILVKTDYKTYFLLENAGSENIIKENETVMEVLNSSHKIRRLQFLKRYQIWNLYNGTNIAPTNEDEESFDDSYLNGKQRAEMRACLYILKKIRAIGVWETGGESFLIINPSLVYISHEMKCDAEWGNYISTMFKLKKNTSKKE